MAGISYLQLDDVYIAGLSAPDFQFKDGKYTREQLIDLALRVINGALEGKPEDLIVTTHLCRGNYQSTWAFEGSYARIAPTLLAKEKVDGFFLEYDDQRSGISNHWNTFQMAVHGSYWASSLQKMEKSRTRKLLRHALKKHRQFVPLEQLCLSSSMRLRLHPSRQQANRSTAMGKAEIRR